MLILSTETSIGLASVCLYDSLQPTEFAIESAGANSMQAETIFPIALKLLEEKGKNISDVDLFTCSIGPGSFTGIRVGLSGFRAASYASGKNFVGVTSLEALANKAIKNSIVYDQKDILNILCFIPAGRGEFYNQTFKINFVTKSFIATSHPQIFSMDELLKISGVDFAITIASKISAEDEVQFSALLKTEIDALDIAEIAAKIYIDKAQNFDGIITPNLDYGNQEVEDSRTLPLYIRPPDAKKANIHQNSVVS